MRRPVVVITVLAVLTVAGAASALPILGASANTLPAGAYMMDTYFLWRNFTRQYDADLYGSGDPGWIELPDERSVSFISLVPRIYYGATDWLTIRASLPLEDRFVSDSVNEDSNTGLGDIVIDPKIRIYQNEERTVSLSLLTGVRLPTGDTNGTPPLSDGSTGYLAGAALTHPAGRLMVHWCATYWLNTEKENGIDAKDMAIGLLSIEDPVSEQWSLLWEMKGYLGVEESDFSRLYICPGAQWSGERLTLSFAAMVPLSGKGSPAVTTLDFDVAPYIRLYYRFF